jgi:hypothetical protein
MINILHVETLILDGNIDIYNEKEILKEWIKKIETFII